MERVAFLLEETGQRLGALLNPNGLSLRRQAGVHPRRSVMGQLSAKRMADDPLLYTGGGRTELDLDLLFDIDVGGSSIQTDDVREITRPLWRLAENSTEPESTRRPPLIRFLWGKAWNFPGVVVAVAERLEEFSVAGAPRRSWLRMRMWRVGETPPPTSRPPGEGVMLVPRGGEVSPDNVVVHEVVGAGNGAHGERLEQIAERYYGNAALWRVIAEYNDISDPLNIRGGSALRIPPISAFARAE